MRGTDTIGGHLRRKIVLGALALGVSALPFHAAHAIDDGALPSGGNIVGGSATLDYGDHRLDIYQNTDRLIIDWNSFNIGKGATTQFHQPGSGSIAVNRVTGGIDPAMILGTLRANGQVIVLDPNGVIFGADSVIDVGGIIASTGRINDHAFMAGSPTLDITGADTGGSIVNHGTITVAEAGIAAFVAPTVKNSGVIQAKLGKISLASGNKATLDLYGDGLVEIAVDGPASKALIENSGKIQAEGGTVLMSAKAAGEAVNGLVNMDGLVDVSSVRVEGGRIVVNGGNIHVAKNAKLDASSTQGGSVELYAQDRTYVEGSIFARGGKGGFIETSAIGTVDIADTASIDTGGGTWLIDPTNFTIANSGGNISTSTLAAQLAANNVTIETATAGSDAGDIFVSDALTWTGANTLMLRAHRNIDVNAAITNTTGGSLLLRADKEGSGTGTITFGGSGSITLAGGGRAELYYNPTAYNAPTNFSGNITGTHTAWMLVNDVTQLQAMNTNLAGAYALGKDIDASDTATWNAGAGFAPIGDNITRFTGQFDGLRHTLSDLTINRPGTMYVGLFGFTNSATIRNATLNDVNVVGIGSVGGLIGIANASTISGIYVYGNVSAITSEYVGGIVGHNTNASMISNSHTGGTVSGVNRVGGLAGANSYGSSVLDSYSSSNVSATATGLYTGGLVGLNYDTSVIERSYATGAINATGGYSGGLVGSNQSSAIRASYATGNVTSDAGAVGGLVGHNTGSITDGYATGLVTGSANNVGGLVGNNNAGTVSSSYATGTVSGSGNAVGGLVGHSTGAVTGSYATGAVSGSGYVGGLVGNGSTITDSYATGAVTGSGNAVGGLAGNSGGAVTNSYATGTVSGGNSVGGLVGGTSGTITNSYATGSSSGVDYIGGLVGTSSGSSIINSYASGNATGNRYVGGLVGNNNGASSIIKSYATGAAKGTGIYTGGLVGANSGSTIDNSYATGAVSGTDGVGGLAGVNANTSNISNSYALGPVTGTINVGGLIGNAWTSTATNSYWNMETTGRATSLGGTGLTTAQMKQMASFSGWSIRDESGTGTIWRIYEGQTVNRRAKRPPYRGDRRPKGPP